MITRPRATCSTTSPIPKCLSFTCPLALPALPELSAAPSPLLQRSSTRPRHHRGTSAKPCWRNSSGRSLDQFLFDQCGLIRGQPELTVEYSWDEKTRLACLAVQQTQRLSDWVCCLLQTALPPSGSSSERPAPDRNAACQTPDRGLYLPCCPKPHQVRLDPDVTCPTNSVSGRLPPCCRRTDDTAPTPSVGHHYAAEHLGGNKEAWPPPFKERLHSDPSGKASPLPRACGPCKATKPWPPCAPASNSARMPARRQVVSRRGWLLSPDRPHDPAGGRPKRAQPDIRSLATHRAGRSTPSRHRPLAAGPQFAPPLPPRTARLRLNGIPGPGQPR